MKNGSSMALLVLALFAIGLFAYAMNQKEDYAYTQDEKLMDKVSKSHKKNNKTYQRAVKLEDLKTPPYDGFPTGPQAPWLPVPPVPMPGDSKDTKPVNYEPPASFLLSANPPGPPYSPTGFTGFTGPTGGTENPNQVNYTGIPLGPTGNVEPTIEPVIHPPEPSECVMNCNPQCPTDTGCCMKLYNPCLDEYNCCDQFQPLVPPLLPYGMN